MLPRASGGSQHASDNVLEMHNGFRSVPLASHKNLPGGLSSQETYRMGDSGKCSSVYLSPHIPFSKATTLPQGSLSAAVIRPRAPPLQQAECQGVRSWCSALAALAPTGLQQGHRSSVA